MFSMRKRSWIGLFVLVVSTGSLQAQVNESGLYVNPEPGERTWRTDLNVNGNQVESIITNYGTIGKGNESINAAGVWPKGTGHGHLHQMTGWVGSRVVDADGVRTVIVSDGYTDGNTGPLAETDGAVEWKFQPKPGYINRSIDQPEIANALNPQSWPSSWPGKDARWDGAWNGFFGLNQFNADQEVYYVVDDWTNREFRYFPYGEDNAPKRGLGLQVDVRLFQWSQALAKDILFMQYEVSNSGNTAYSNQLADHPLFFGGYTDTNPGGAGSSNDAAAFDQQRDLVYGWAFDGIGTWTQFREIPPGHVGWKFLESPGIPTDGIDNDADGLVDESRDNDAGTLVISSCGIYGEAREHWSGDEDCDWNAQLDDKGVDGIGPDDEGYPGPDPDGSEGNGRPDQGEPNFGKLDKDESDQIGLTSFNAPPFGVVDIKDEEAMWPTMQPGYFDVPLQNANQVWIFASGPFNLPTNRTQRFSTAFLWGRNQDALFRTAAVAQRIYDADYRFARPPRQPAVQAVAGDGRVTLLWDDLAEQSRDPIYGRDFEGYRIIKSTDPQFRDAQDITDAYGNAVFKRSIAQFDKVNGLTGPHALQFGEEIGLPNGIHFPMGTDTGLQHSYVDEDVTNGRTYYYAVLSYDAGYDVDYFERGISELDKLFPISPSESPGSITVTNGVITRFDRNTVAVTPNPPASDVVQGSLEVDRENRLSHVRGAATGTVRAVPLSGDLLRDATYAVSFEAEQTGSAVDYRTATYSVVDQDGLTVVDRAPVPQTMDGTQRQTWTHELLDDGIILQFENAETTLSGTQLRSGWTDSSQTNLLTTVETYASFDFPEPPLWPINVVIEVADSASVVDTAFYSRTGNRLTPVSFKVYDGYTGDPLEFVFNEQRLTRNGRIDTLESIQLAFLNTPDDRRYSLAWTIRFEPPVDASGDPVDPRAVVIPQPGDRYVLRPPIPFGPQDQYSLAARRSTVDATASQDILDAIRVVPNPYIVSNVTERRPYGTGRGERRIYFRHLPADAMVRIYNASGAFVREIQGMAGVAEWDLQSFEGLDVAFGLYFYHVDAPGIGTHTGKFAIVN